ncbi:heme ABC transporter permease [Modicisalibacter radicis]|uniref:heme ABC transporter permease n=1 Tax=Halomonas sp. EAR18 TaxID=2518972 RepID=UPI00109CD408|nr:heme ABC transporter permease [Halomonas sp. EAR18]
MWRAIHRLGSPAIFYAVAGRLQPWCWALAIALLLAGSLWGLVWAPADYQQGDSVRILYVHVPTALLAQSVFVLLAAAGGVFLVWRIKLADMLAAAIAPFGALMTLLALVSGALWGLPTWGTWWVWDARLTSMLIQLFLYLGVIALRGAYTAAESGARASALLALVGVVNVPIIKFSVDWWQTLHQAATFSLVRPPSMPASMWLPLLVMVAGFYAFFVALALTRTRSEILRRESRTRWVRERVARTTGKAAR